MSVIQKLLNDAAIERCWAIEARLRQMIDDGLFTEEDLREKRVVLNVKINHSSETIRVMKEIDVIEVPNVEWVIKEDKDERD